MSLALHSICSVTHCNCVLHIVITHCNILHVYMLCVMCDAYFIRYVLHVMYVACYMLYVICVTYNSLQTLVSWVQSQEEMVLAMAGWALSSSELPLLPTIPTKMLLQDARPGPEPLNCAKSWAWWPKKAWPTAKDFCSFLHLWYMNVP